MKNNTFKLVLIGVAIVAALFFLITYLVEA
jgi:hypothetical protein